MNIVQAEIAQFSTGLEAVHTELENAVPKLTFWGERVIEVKKAGRVDSIVLDELSSKIEKTAEIRYQKKDLTLQERLTGVALAKKVTRFYDETDNLVKQANFFTKLCILIRNFSFSFSLPVIKQFSLRKAENDFCTFEKEKFFATFGGSFDPRLHYHPDALSRGALQWIVAEEESIRRKARESNA